MYSWRFSCAGEHGKLNSSKLRLAANPKTTTHLIFSVVLAAKLLHKLPRLRTNAPAHERLAAHGNEVLADANVEMFHDAFRTLEHKA